MTDHNQCFFSGRVSQAPKAFGPVTKLTIATNDHFRNPEGKTVEKTRFVPLTILRDKLAASVLANVRVGDNVVATCTAAAESYKNGEGRTVYETQLVAHTFTNYGPSTKPDQAHDD